MITIVALGLGGLLWLLLSVYWAKDIKPSDTVWDDTLQEGNAPMPKWWFFMLFGFLIFSAAYLMLYPGLGRFPGLLGWSQSGQFQQGMKSYQQGKLQQDWANLPLADLAANASYMASARRIYANHCAACHGEQGQGQARFPNLRDDEWQWGNSKEQLLQTITQGRTAVMPAWRATVGDGGVLQLTDYVLSLSGNRALGGTGKQLYVQHCAACHGVDGRGNPILGASNLRDNVWLYGGDRHSVYASISKGRQGIMPAQKNRLRPEQIRLLVAWLFNGMDNLPAQ